MILYDKLIGFIQDTRVPGGDRFYKDVAYEEATEAKALAMKGAVKSEYEHLDRAALYFGQYITPDLILSAQDHFLPVLEDSLARRAETIRQDLRDRLRGN